MTEVDWVDWLLKAVKKGKIEAVYVNTKDGQYISLDKADFNTFLKKCLEHAEEIKALPTEKPKGDEDEEIVV